MKPLLILTAALLPLFSVHAQTYEILYSDNTSGGSAGLTLGSDGNFYGATESGGVNGFGTIFKMTTSGIVTTLHSCNDDGEDGPLPDSVNPHCVLSEGSDGSFYGTTNSGSYVEMPALYDENGDLPPMWNGPSFGSVFKVTPAGVLTTLHTFTDDGSLEYPDHFSGYESGIFPVAGLVKGSDGNFYGTTSEGGVDELGAIFKITAGGVLNTLHTFNGLDGGLPISRLVLGNDGNLYGTTLDGGLNNMGTVFKMTPGGTLTTLHSFTGTTDGVGPTGELALGSDGNFYGTTGGNTGVLPGTVFKITPSGTLTTLHTFNGSNGNWPNSGLVKGSDGNFYGTTEIGGANGRGTVFKITSTGTLTTLHSFDTTVLAGYSKGTPTFGPDGNLYGTAVGSTYGTSAGVTPLVIWRINLADTTTSPPTLITPADNTITDSPISVSFTLPETAMLGSVKLSFGSTQLTLDASQESAGTHSFTFNPANPTASLEIESGSPIVDGTYTVTLSYQDLAGNAAASDSNSGVIVDTITLVPTLTAPVAATTYGNPVSVSFSLPEAALPGSVKLAFEDTVLTLAASQETAGVHSFTFNPANPTASPEIASGAAIDDDTYTVTLSYRDVYNHPASSDDNSGVIIDAVPNGPSFELRYSKGGTVPDPILPPGSLWTKLGIPSINEAGHIAVLGDWKAGTVSGSGIFRGGPGAVSLQLVAKKGDAVPGLTNVVYGVMKDPLLGVDGSVAFVTALANAPSTTGAVTTTNNSAIVLDPDGPGAAAAVMVARKGTAATGAGGATWKSFDSMALGAEAVGIVGKVGAPATTANDLGLWVYNRNTSTTTLALREGGALLGSTVKTIGALVARAAAGGQGRGVENDGSADQIAVRVTLANGGSAVGAIAEDGSLAWSHQNGGTAAGYTGATWKSFGLPGQNTATAQAFVATAQGGSATTANNVAIFTEDDTTFALSRRVKKGDTAVGISGGLFSGFKDPVNAEGGAFAFVGSTAVSSSAGIASTSNDGVWYHNGSTLRLVAREGAQPPGTAAGAKWKAFTSVALPDGRAPLFYATLLVGQGGVTAGSDTGIWAADSLGQVKKLIQEGDAFGSSTVKSFKALLPVAGSPAQTRSFNSEGEVVIQVTDAAGGTHLLHVEVP